MRFNSSCAFFKVSLLLAESCEVLHIGKIFLYPVPHIKAIEELCSGFSEVVEQIKIKISGSRLL